MPKLTFTRMKVSLEMKKSTYFLLGTMEHLNCLFVPARGHLPVCFQKVLMPGVRPGGGRGGVGGWEQLESGID